MKARQQDQLDMFDSFIIVALHWLASLLLNCSLLGVLLYKFWKK